MPIETTERMFSDTVQQDARQRRFTFKRGYLPASCDYYSDPIAKLGIEPTRGGLGLAGVAPAGASAGSSSH